MTRKKTRQLKWKKTVVVVDQSEGNQLCLACGNAYDVISPCPPYPEDESGFCPHCGGEIVERIELGEDEGFADWVSEVIA